MENFIEKFKSGKNADELSYAALEYIYAFYTAVDEGDEATEPDPETVLNTWTEFDAFQLKKEYRRKYGVCEDLPKIIDALEHKALVSYDLGGSWVVANYKGI